MNYNYSKLDQIWYAKIKIKPLLSVSSAVILSYISLTISAAESARQRARSSSFYEPAAVAVTVPCSDPFAGFDFTGLPRAVSASSCISANSADADSERTGAAVSPRPVYDLEMLQRRNTELVAEKLNLERELEKLRGERTHWVRVKHENVGLKNNNSELARERNELLAERESDHRLLDSLRAQLAVAMESNSKSAAAVRPVTCDVSTDTDTLPKPAPIILIRPAAATGVASDLKKLVRVKSAVASSEISGVARPDSPRAVGTIMQARRASRAVLG